MIDFGYTSRLGFLRVEVLRASVLDVFRCQGFGGSFALGMTAAKHQAFRQPTMPLQRLVLAAKMSHAPSLPCISYVLCTLLLSWH